MTTADVASHIHLDERGRAWIDDTNTKVIEVTSSSRIANSVGSGDCRMRRQLWILCILQPLFLGLAHATIDDKPTLGGRHLESWVNLLKTSQKPDERKRAAFAIRGFGDRAASAVPELIAALDDQEEGVRDNAIGALTELRGLAAKAVPALAARLGDDRLNGGGFDRLRYPVYKALAAIGQPTVAELSRALSSKVDEVRWRAAKALQLIGPEAKGASEVLAKHLDDPIEYVAYSCVEALQAIGPEARATIPTLSTLLRQTDFLLKDRDENQPPNPRFVSLVDALAALGAEPDPVLIRELGSERPLSRLAALSMIRKYGPRARSQVSRVERLLADPDLEEIRAGAAMTLSRIDPPGTAAIDRLVAGLSSPDPKLRVEADWILAKIGPLAKGAIPALTQALKDPDREVREEAALAIAEIDPTIPAAVEILTEMFRRASKNGEHLAHRTALALGYFGPLAREAIPVLSDNLKGSHSFNGSDATLEALFWIDPSGESVAHALVGALGTSDKGYRLVFLRLLADLGPRASLEVPAIVKMMKDEDEEIRREAAHALGRIGSGAAAAVPTLMTISRDDVRPVRLAAIEALGRIGLGGHKAAPGLIDAVRREADLGYIRSVVALIHLDPLYRTTAAKLAQESDDFHFRAAVQGALGQETFDGQAVTRLTIRDLDPALETKRERPSGLDVPNPLVHALNYLDNFGAGARSALPWISRAMRNTDPRVRRAAEFTFDQIQKSAPRD
jgi:HEAT repeat protein